MRLSLNLAAWIYCLGLGFGLGSLWLQAAWPFVVFQASMAIALLVLTTQRKQLVARIIPNPLLVLPFLGALIAILQIAVSGSIGNWETRQAAFEWTSYGVAAFLSNQFLQDARLRREIVFWFAVVAVALAIVSVSLNFANPGLAWGIFETGFRDQVFGPFLYHSKFANFLELGLGAAFWSAAMNSSRRWIALAMAAVMVAAIVASASRGGAIVAGIEVAVLLWLFLKAQSDDSDRWFLSLAFLSAILMALCLFGTEALSNRFRSEDLAQDARFAIQLSNLAMAKDYFWLGSGLGTWHLLYPAYARFDIGVVVNQAHNDWIQWLIEGGLPMMAVTISILVSACLAARKEWWGLGFVFVWIHGLLDYPMQQNPAFCALQIAFWGAALASFNHTTTKRSMDRSDLPVD